VSIDSLFADMPNKVLRWLEARMKDRPSDTRYRKEYNRLIALRAKSSDTIIKRKKRTTKRNRGKNKKVKVTEVRVS